MAKIIIKFTAKELVEQFALEGDITDSILEYAPDHGFPDNTDFDTVNFLEVTEEADGKVGFAFEYYEENDGDEEEEEEDEDEDSED